MERGDECREVFAGFARALTGDYRAHDPLIQALAAHDHLAAMHPFLDGNGRTARALEALMLQRAGLRDTCFIPMSNYYYDEKARYLAALSGVRAGGHDLTPFLLFGLQGARQQSLRLLTEMRRQVSKALFRDVMFELFKRLKTPRRRVMADRQIQMLKLLLELDSVALHDLIERIALHYATLKSPVKAVHRDLMELMHLKAIAATRHEESGIHFQVRLEWPTEITETEFFKRVKRLPKAGTYALFQ